MKKIIYLILLITTLSSCDVSVINPNTLTGQTFWKSESDAKFGLNAVYNMFYKPAMYTRWYWFRTDLTSDEGFSASPWAELKDWTSFNYLNYDFAEGNTLQYHSLYQTIFRANQVIVNVPAINFANQADKDIILAQAYFLRGLAYYQLATFYGSSNKSIAIVLEPSKPGDTPSGHDKTTVYNQAISDFTQSLTMSIPEVWSEIDKGRATKGAAYAFRAKCYMQLHDYESAQTDLNWLVEGEGSTHYGLVANFQDNFTTANENNEESVFELQYSDINKAPSGDDDFATDPNLGQNRGQFFAPPGIGWTDGELRPWIVEEFKRELNLDAKYDVRLKYTALYEGMDSDFDNNNRIYKFDLKGADANIWSEGNWRGRVFFRKYSSEHYRDFDDYHNPTNIRMVRYSDILLLYAECIAENGGDLSKAVGYVNRVRARVNMPELATNHLAATLSNDAFLKRLQMERMLELCSEGHRWIDIKRWGLLESQDGINELKARDVDFNNFTIGKHDCLPIPSSETSNNLNISQNTNY